MRLTTGKSYNARDDECDQQDETLVVVLVIGSRCRSSELLLGDLLQKDIRSWLSPPDPSKNYNIACRAHYGGTAEWFIHGDTFEEWKAMGTVLWIHGKRAWLARPPFVCFADTNRPLNVVAGSGKSVLSYVSSMSYFQRAHVGS